MNLRVLPADEPAPTLPDRAVEASACVVTSGEVRFNGLPLEEAIVRELAQAVEAMFDGLGRTSAPAECVSFGYDDGLCLTVLARNPHRVILLHPRNTNFLRVKLLGMQLLANAIAQSRGSGQDVAQLLAAWNASAPAYPPAENHAQTGSPGPTRPQPPAPAASDQAVGFAPRADISQVATPPESTFSMDSPPTSPGMHVEWRRFQAGFEALLSKVLGSAQTTRMIQREMNAFAIKETTVLSLQEAHAFGARILERVPNTAKRATLMMELNELIETLSLP